MLERNWHRKPFEFTNKAINYRTPNNKHSACVIASIILSMTTLITACSGTGETPSAPTTSSSQTDAAPTGHEQNTENSSIEEFALAPSINSNEHSHEDLRPKPKTLWQPTADTPLIWDWQIGHLTPQPNKDVDVYNIDIDTEPEALHALKATGAKLICYFSVGTIEDWREDANQFPAELIGERYEQLPGERWLNYKEIDKLAPIMLARLDRCAARGFDAVEADNVDAFNYETRNKAGEVIRIGTNFQITEADTVRYVRWLAEAAHERNLAIGLKNAEAIAADIVNDIDFMVTEECILYDWCSAASVIIENNKPIFAAEYIDFPGTQSLSYVCEQATTYGFFASHFETTLNNSYFIPCKHEQATSPN